MRTGMLVVVALSWVLTGATCLPIIDNVTRQRDTGETLAVILTAPTTDMTVPQGEEVVITWSASNLTGDAATLTVYAESRTDLSIHTLMDRVPFEGTGNSGTYTWDTQEFSGPYKVYATLATASDSYTDGAGAVIEIDPPPTFEFTSPRGQVSFTLNQSPVDPLVISWIAGDNNATARIGLDVDTDHVASSDDTDDDDRNEIYLTEIELTGDAAADSLEWEGQDENGDDVPADLYYLFVVVSDGVNSNLVIPDPNTPLAQRISIEVLDPGDEEEPEALAITSPKEDVVDMINDPNSLPITFEVNQSKDVLIDLKLDTDDNHANGNEHTILARRFVEADTGEVTIDWDGKDTGGTDIAVGIYRLLLVSSTGSGTPTTIESEGFIFRRDDENQPLIALLKPVSTTTVDNGNLVTIEWRDDDPVTDAELEDDVDPTNPATIRIVLDDDGDPATTGDQITILDNWEERGDGVRDTFHWYVPTGALTAGEDYSIIAYIDRAGSGNHSIAPGKLIMNDPTNP